MLHALNAPPHLRPASLRAARLASLERVVEPHVVDFNGPQYRFVTDQTTPNLAFIGGLGSGKTFGLAWGLVFEQFYERGTGTMGGLFGNTYQQIEQVTLPALWGVYESLGFQYGEHYVYGEKPPRFWDDFESRFKRHNGVVSHRFLGQIVTRSLDNPHSIRGIEIGHGWQDEMRDSTREAFNVLIGRIRCPRARRHRYRGSTTPNGYNWIYEVFVEKKNPRFGMVHAKTRDNWALPPDYYENLESTYDPKQLRQEAGGEFLSITSGAVYHQFDRRVHVVPSLAVDPKADWQVSFDFNRSPMTAVIMQTPRVGKEQVVYCLDEVRLFESGSEQAADEVVSRLLRHCGGELPAHVDIFGDASGTSGSTKSRYSDYDNIVGVFERRIPNRYARRWKFSNPSVDSRVNAVNAMLRNGLGQVRMFFHPRCEHLVRDLERVTYAVGSSSINKTGEQNKLLTHLSDALGYYVESVFPIRGIPSRGRINI